MLKTADACPRKETYASKSSALPIRCFAVGALESLQVNMHLDVLGGPPPPCYRTGTEHRTPGCQDVTCVCVPSEVYPYTYQSSLAEGNCYEQSVFPGKERRAATGYFPRYACISSTCSGACC